VNNSGYRRDSWREDGMSHGVSQEGADNKDIKGFGEDCRISRDLPGEKRKRLSIEVYFGCF